MLSSVLSISVHAGDEPRKAMFAAEEEAIERMDKILFPDGTAILSSPDAEQTEENLVLNLGRKKIYGIAEVVGYEINGGKFRITDLPEERMELAMWMLRKRRA